MLDIPACSVFRLRSGQQLLASPLGCSPLPTAAQPTAPWIHVQLPDPSSSS